MSLANFSLVLLLPVLFLLLLDCLSYWILNVCTSHAHVQHKVPNLFFSSCVGDLVAKSGHYCVISSDNSLHCSGTEERCPTDV